jgi:hypothetical protein
MVIELASFHTFEFASVKNFVEKKPPRPRRRPGATGARIVPNPQRATIPRCDGTSSCRHASNPCCELGQLALRFRRAARKRQRTGALQDASRISGVTGQRASVLDCGSPLPLFPAVARR